MADGCVDAIVTDPPYEIGMMGRKWDGTGVAYDVGMWAEALRVLKPGGYIVSFSSSRTWHRMAVAIEDAGFVTHPMIGWLTGQGFPKATRLQVPNTEHLRYGLQALKPALEPIYMGQKPMVGTGTRNWLTHGTGALNIGACRVNPGEFTKSGGRSVRGNGGVYGDGIAPTAFEPHNAGRWPANVIHDGSDEVLEAFAAFGSSKSKSGGKAGATVLGVMNDDAWKPRETARGGHDDEGSPARFFYAAKASRAERNQSKHPTQKPLALMRYLCKLITPPGGTVLDMFAGSGTTLLAAQLEGFDAVGIEQDAAYVADARRRLGITFQLEAAD